MQTLHLYYSILVVNTHMQKMNGSFYSRFIVRSWKKNRNLRVGDLVWNSKFNARNSRPERLLGGKLSK